MGFTGGYYTGGGNSAGTVMAILLLLAVVLTVLAFIFIVPENRREKLSAFGKFLHDTCNFNYLLIEKILQALYIFLTVFAILMGLYTLVHNFWVGLALTIIMPIAIRLIYEFLMMAVLLLKHVIMIDNKLKNQNTVDKKPKTADPEFISREPKKPSPTPAPAKPAVKKAAPATKPAAEKTAPAAKPAAKPAPKAAPVKAETETPVKTAPVKKTVPTETASEAPVKKAPAKPVVEKAAPAETASEPVSAPVKTEAPASPKARFCTECGSPLDENGKCPNCSK
ncbi:hypothetical protein KE540_15030 [Lachnospiraceae bacterium Marseille-Q4251]|uniref:Uncharacterized protein n=1 Tax=Fusicatenibacter faecihominis TaxID=2881276 RepID=A0AAE3J773_9FIRM|nr:zinc ribbon domain-containing protein [Fusicatenibacter faecihominis]MBR9941505.1 hypothetical protein [Lachnospiraceae bacterium Marseille-Q4251]MCC2190692.1 hypothetical protein [Fusicatenibacter faecihominis]